MDEIREACDCPIDCIVNCTVKVHKRMKSIVRIVHPPSVVQSEFNEATRKLFLRKENKTMSLFNNSSPLVAPFLRISAGGKQRTLLCVSRILEDGLSDDAFYTFMDLDSAIYYAVNGTVTSLPVLIQNILNCVPKMNKAFMGWERHGGK